MKTKSLFQVFIIALIFLISFSCKKSEKFISESVSEYFPLTVGKYITYRIDSTVFTNLGRTEEIHRYQVKHVVDAQVTDNIGRPGFRIYRYLRDSSGTLAWRENGTYFITPLTDQVEVSEDNLRYIKLHLPIALDFQWKGNKHLSSNPFFSLYNFNNDDNMNKWDYRYDKFESSATIGGKTLNNIYTVAEADEAINAPVTNAGLYGSRNFAIEKYAKNIGLVYRELILWEYQPNTGGGSGFKTGFGIKMWMIDKN
jgi:hypothetical protein